MKLIVGLGNPGPQYTKTRHNAGFMVVDRLVQRHAASEPAKARFNASTVETTIGGERCILVKPLTFMNRSGQSVAEAVRFFKLEPYTDLLVIVDDLYLPVGGLRLRPDGGTAGHNGLADIQRALGADVYPRCRVGVGLKREDGSVGKHPLMDQADFVLQRFTEEEWPLLEPALDKAADASEMFVSKGLAAAMNKFNGSDGTKSKPSSNP
ncbi:MAG: aminoacyl-tRNA hydrolase [Planctomycetota bacterium]|nr:aminoacyl-tRNA hydrolase [Planctomycetota bacterium]